MSWLQLAFRCFIFVVLAGVFLFKSVSPAWTQGITATSPLWSLLAFRSPLVSLTSILVGVCVLILVCVRKRFFCRFVCPLGLLQDLLRFVQKRTKTAVSIVRSFPGLGKILLFATLLALIFGGTFGAFALDPLVLFSTLFSPNVFYFSTSVVVIAAIGLLLFVGPFFYCQTICPCGAFQDVVFSLTSFVRRSFVPSKRFRLGEPSDVSVPKSLRRRWFLKTSSLVACSVGLFLVLRRKIVRAVLRPPGSIEESSFLARCVRCGRCVSVCPTKAIQPTRTPPLALNSPKMNYDEGYCDENCLLCGQICPTGAIQELTPSQKKSWKIAKPEFQLDRCLLYYNRECSICRRECPQDAIRFVWSEEEYLNVPIFDDAKCNGCGRCVHFCPGVCPDESQNEDSSDVPAETSDELAKTSETSKPLKAIRMVPDVDRVPNY